MGLKIEVASGGVIIQWKIALGVRQFARDVYSIYINVKRLTVRNVYVNIYVMHCDTY